MQQDKDIEVKFLLKEYEKLNNEIISRETTRTQLTTISIVLVGGIITVIPILLNSGLQGLSLKVSPLYLVFMFLTATLLFTSLQWTHLLHDFEVGCTANYLDQNIRRRACQLLQIDEDSAWILNWDRYHIKILYPSSSIAWIRMLNISRYIIMFIPALLLLLGAALIYLSYFSISMANWLDWIAISLFIFDFFYLIATVPAYRHIQRVYQKIPHHFN